MFTMAKIRDGSTYLGNHLCANDYYSEDEKVSGVWQGELARAWGIEGQGIDAGDTRFENLRVGLTPDGEEKLTQRGGGEVRFYDFQCAAAKSVSVQSMLDGRLAEAHERAARVAFSELERFAARQVQGKAAVTLRQREETGQVCAAVFRHDASRELDPQLHSHHVVANVTLGKDGKRYSLETREMVEAIRYAGKAYQNELARECRALGYELVERRHERTGEIEGFELAGVSPEVCRRYSQRRAQVEMAMAAFEKEKGRAPSSAEIAVMTRQTRSHKLKEITTPEVRAAQIARLSGPERAGLEDLAAQARGRGPLAPLTPAPSAEAARLVEAALAHRFERVSTAKGHEVLADALNARLGHIDTAQLVAALGNQAVRLSPAAEAGAHRAEWTTRENLSRERWSVGFVDAGQGACAPLRASTTLRPGAGLDKLATEQREAVAFVCSTKDQVVAVRGVAGAGKTTTLKELDRQLEDSGATLLYLAPTRGAVDVLQKEGFAKATTVSDYLTRSEHGKDDPAWRGAVLVVDEAGLQSTKQGSEVLHLAERHGNRVVFVGDTRQHSSVEAGDFLRILETHSKLESRELKDVRRQTQADYNLAVRAMAQGQAAAGFEQLDRLGWIKEGQANYLGQAAADYVSRTLAGQDVLGVAPTWAENHVMTGEVRAGLRAAGKLGAEKNLVVHEPTQWTRVQRADVGLYQPGMIVSFRQDGAGAKRGQSVLVDAVEGGKVRLSNGATLTLSKADRFDVARPREMAVAVGDKLLMRANSPDKKLVNGAVLTVASVGKDGRIATVEGPTIPPEFRAFSHGYVVTSHKAQGRTHDVVVGAMAQANAQTFYVTASRGRKECALYTPDKAVLAERLPRSGERRAALDALKAERTNQSKAASPGILVRAKAWMEMKLEQAVERIGGGRSHAHKARPAEKTVNREAAAGRARKVVIPPLPARRGRERGMGMEL